MKNICFVHNVDVVGGAERVSQSIMRALNKQHYNLRLVAPAIGPLITECKQLGVIATTHDLTQPEWRQPLVTYKAYRKWESIIKDFELDIFHTGDLLSARSLLYAAKKNTLKVICHIHFPFKRDFAEWVFKSRAKPDGFIFCSQELQDSIGKMLFELCPDAKQWVVHNGVDVNTFIPSKVNNIKKRIGIIANLQIRKGHDDFLQMAKHLKDDGYDLCYEIIGGDILQAPREPILKEKAQQLGLAQDVTFHGQISNVKEMLQQLDILVCASHEEAFPISILEAMACGKAIVSTNVNGIPEAVIDGQTGYLAPPFSPKLLAEKVKTLLDAPSKIERFGQAGRMRVEQNFSEQQYIAQIESIYESL